MVEYKTEAKLDIITLNDSDHGNVLNLKSLQLIYDAIKNAEKNPDSRVIILKSDGRNFCLGMDLNFLQSIDNDKTAKKSVALYTNLLTLIQTVKKPVIAIVNGNVKAGGIGLVSTCDIVIASEQSNFEFSEIFFGLIPANVLPFLYNLRLSPQKIKYLILTAKKVSAEEAYKIGLVDEFFAEDKLQKGIKKILKNIFRASPMAIAETKQFMNSLYNKNQDEAINLAREKLLMLIKKPEVLSAIKSFNEGGTPDWFEKYNGLEL